MEYVTCNLCGSAEASILFELSDYLLERPEVHATLVKCSGCGLVYQNPRPSPGEIGEHYPPEYELYDPAAISSPANPLLQRAYDYGLRKRRRYLTRYCSGGRVLDLGCATGAFLAGLGRSAPGKWDLYGVEPSPQAAEAARRHPGLKVTTGLLEEAGYPGGYFDAVTLWDVLEHLHDPRSTLGEIHRILKPEGALVLRLPNIGSRAARLFGKHWGGLEPPRHLYVFDHQTLDRLVRLSGFEPLHTDTAISAYLSYVQSLRFRMVDRGLPAARRDRILRLLHHPLARLLSAPFFYFDSLGLKGPALVMVAKKSASGTVNPLQA